MKHIDAIRDASRAFSEDFDKCVQATGLVAEKQDNGDYTISCTRNDSVDNIDSVLDQQGLSYEKHGSLYLVSCALTVKQAAEEGLGTKLPNAGFSYPSAH